MAILHRAQLSPTKMELLAAWVPGQPWSTGTHGLALTRLGAYRFDDPDGEVGIETFLVRAGDGPVLQVPLTYRGAPLDGADAALVGTMEHSVLGRRWVYDGCADPVHTAALTRTVLTGAAQADELVDLDGQLQRRETDTCVVGSGTAAGALAGAQVGAERAEGATHRDLGALDLIALAAAGAVQTTHPAGCTLVRAGDWQIALARVVGSLHAPDGALTLTGTWPGLRTPAVLAAVQPA